MTTQALVSVRNITPSGGSVSAVFCSNASNLTTSFYSFYIHTCTHYFPHILYVAPLNVCSSRSAGSVGTERIRNVFVCPRPPFQPCTAMIVQPGWIKFKAIAPRNPNLMRLSTYSHDLSWKPIRIRTKPHTSVCHWWLAMPRGSEYQRGYTPL